MCDAVFLLSDWKQECTSFIAVEPFNDDDDNDGDGGNSDGDSDNSGG